MAHDCNLSHSKAGENLKGSSLTASDKLVAENLLSDINKSKLDSSGMGARCLPGDMAVDHFTFRGGEDAKTLAETFGLPNLEIRKPEDISHVILDSRGGSYDHSYKAKEALQSGDPSIKDSSILNLQIPKRQGDRFKPEHAVLQDPKDRDTVTEVHNYMDLVNKDLGRATEFSKKAIAGGGEPPTYILPIVTNPYHLAMNAEDAKGPFAITAKELGVSPVLESNPMDPKYKEAVLKGLTNLAASGDYRAQSILESVSSLNKLGDTGSKVYLSSSNHDMFELTTYLTSFHDNIYSATSTDRHGKPVEFNKRIAKYAEVKGSGTVLGVPDSLRGKLDRSELPHAIIHKPLEPDAMAGKEIERVKATDQDVDSAIADINKYKPFEELSETVNFLDHGAGSIKYEGEPAFVDAVVENWDSLVKINKAAGSPIDLTATDDKSKANLVERIMRDQKLVDKFTLASGQMIKQGLIDNGFEVPEDPNDKPFDAYFKISESLFEWGNKVEESVQSKLYTFDQLLRLRKTRDLGEEVGTEPRTKDFIYRPNDLAFSRVSTYLKANTLDGKTVAIPFEYGNSFGAPYAAGVNNKLSRAN